MKPFEAALFIALLIGTLWASIHVFEVDVTDPQETYHFGHVPVSSEARASRS